MSSDHQERKTIVVKTKMSMADVRRELFGPIQEAARKPYPFALDPSTIWCKLSELRLCMLIMEHKPVGEERSVKKMSIFEGLNRIRDDEHPSVKFFLSEENQMAFDKQRVELARGSTVRMVFPPKYTLRPTLAAIEKKLEEWYNLAICEKNEPNSQRKAGAGTYQIPAYILAEMEKMNAENGNGTST
ncbi:Protein CBG21369 [Caenorhabditis briggsae]|uniref:Protein CBG21369 n=1 Tax=Caenorhabditis briggsae TaxID=6238 RepID=A8XZY2_CAEBR|nr:Protein CBG21369 [Caenorhabditis briggsae]CAP38199.1 Protein CBG21369 [Caenorhabditis briggsae]